MKEITKDVKLCRCIVLQGYLSLVQTHPPIQIAFLNAEDAMEGIWQL